MKKLREVVEIEPKGALSMSVGEAVSYASVEIGPDGVAERDARGRVVFVPRAEIRRIVLRRGIAAERPGVLAFFGLLCFGVAWLAWKMIARWWVAGGTLYAETVSGLAMIPLGVGIFWALLRPRFYLRVETQSDVRHLIFRGRIERSELRRFIARVEATQMLSIEQDAPGVDRAPPYR